MNIGYSVMKTAFAWFIFFAAFHSLFSWLLLSRLWSQSELRTEIFGTVKTLVLGPKTVRLRYLVWAKPPLQLRDQQAGIQKIYHLSIWTARIAGILLMVSFTLQIFAMINHTPIR
jgi:hypothetical protein